ncbi:hypothetical protein [Microbacterium sp. SORGH_AS_0888]|uniref:hypothetical protein n=1 Tax=Microbacterium sp. SORGH_AS_0888 TaxID=3041791 RepID=UPI002788479E|nr:hypothetical protein [Microbacterium sp. SORGH_AS_0888]MDQ1130763.1 hypothetical protein [Microbacterium sp. SORGH_AS_0888]
MNAARRLAVGGALLVLVAGLAACAPRDPRAAEEAASAVFDDLVAAAGRVDTAVLRTLEVDDPSELACARPEGSVQRVYTARGTLAVEAADADASLVVDAVAARLDPGRWDTIRAPEPRQSAWTDEDGTVATVTADGPVIAIAVFTPCLAAG